MPTLAWDVFCRVIDNHGDLGVCWRLARTLAARGDSVRLVVDDPAALRWMAPDGAPGVQVVGWPGAAPVARPADVVVEAFGCDPPAAYVSALVQRQAQQQPVPVWVNLEYLSAESWVERAHRLPSPQPGGLTKWFFFPGFTAATGGLLRETDLPARRAAHDTAVWLQDHGIHPQPGERLATLFCYDNPALAGWLAALAARPTLLLATPGPAQRQLAGLPLPPGLRVQALPWLTQEHYDQLLWSAELNVVRGEDSLLRAVWAGAPFIWHIYPQHDQAHHAKLNALLEQLQPPPDVAALWRAFNGLPGAGMPATLPDTAAGAPWAAATRRWAAALAAQDDLATQLRAFVLDRADLAP